ncbi:hypothetical protein [Brachybacterium sp.]|uniref:hypothetical protein n=1 Tax=Brachybacterium sp. TaxID=1891286 RepID=UPI002ED3CF50
MSTTHEPEPEHDVPDLRAPEDGAHGGGPASGAVLFSSAPAAKAEDSSATHGTGEERRGGRWFLPQVEPARSPFDDLVDIEQDPAGAAEVYARLPLVHRAVTLLAHVGEGREVTSTGGLALEDVQALLESWELDLGDQEITSMWQVAEIVGPWKALVSGGWLEVSGVSATPGAGPAPAVGQHEDPVAFVRFCRAMILLMVLDALKQDPEGGGVFGGPDTFAALMHTVSPDGLTLPATLRGAIGRGLVPSDLGGDPDMDEVQRYWRTERDLTTLTTYGLLRRETTPDGQDTRFRGTPEVIVDAFGALEAFAEVGAVTAPDEPA